MKKELNILLIEDSEDDALLLLRELRKQGYDPRIERVETVGRMESAIREREWDIVISDYVMPAFSGLDALRTLKCSGLDLPFIIVSGQIGEETAVDLMKAGAHDYILKGNLARLAPAIEREMHEAEVRRKKKEAEDTLRKLNDELEKRVKERTVELEEKNAELERMNKLFVGREIRMVELKEDVQRLEKEIESLRKE
ncbi:MAG TPA: response regulator [Geobacteraceae bacterium]|nr:response regulator [Geobacteraceae bacterium]